MQLSIIEYFLSIASLLKIFGIRLTFFQVYFQYQCYGPRCLLQTV